MPSEVRCTKDTSEKNVSSNDPTSEMLIQSNIDLLHILNSSSEGKRILSNYSKLSTFTNDDRFKIADIMEKYDKINFNRKITKERLHFFVDKIIETFPSEKKDNWILNIILPDGKHSSEITRFFKGGNFETVNRICKVIPKIKMAATEKDKRDAPIVLTKSKQLLKEAWSALEQKWKETAEQRNQEILKSNHVFHDYFRKYPLLSEPNGYVLFENDFEFLYPKAVNIWTEWPKMCLFVENIIKEKIPSFCENTTTAELRMMKLLMNIAKIFPVPSFVRRPDVSHSNICTRFQSQQSFLLVIESVEDLQSAYERHISNVSQGTKKKMLPLPVVLGNVRQVKKSFVILDSAIYEVNNPLKAIDVAFKIFRILHLQYPTDCEQIWTFLQQAVYKIFTDVDKNDTATSELVAKYQNTYTRSA